MIDIPLVVEVENACRYHLNRLQALDWRSLMACEQIAYLIAACEESDAGEGGPEDDVAVVDLGRKRPRH